MGRNPQKDPNLGQNRKKYKILLVKIGFLGIGKVAEEFADVLLY